MADTAYRLQGLQGGVVIDPGDRFTGLAREVYFPAASEVSFYSGNLADGDTKLTGVTFPAGGVLRGQTTGIELASGVAIVLIEDSAYTIS